MSASFTNFCLVGGVNCSEMVVLCGLLSAPNRSVQLAEREEEEMCVCVCVCVCVKSYVGVMFTAFMQYVSV